MSEIFYHITEKSHNRKTGSIPVITSSKLTCSPMCPFIDKGCYGDGGPINIHWNEVTKGKKRALSFNDMLKKLDKLAKKKPDRIRLWQVGDMPGFKNRIHVENTNKLIKTLKQFKYPFGYTHKPINKFKNKRMIKKCNDNGITINLSANNLVHADKLYRLKIGPVSVTLPKDISQKNIKTPSGISVRICLAVLSDKIQCANCGGSKGPICWRKDRNFIVGFPAHGFRAKNATDIANGVFKY